MLASEIDPRDRKKREAVGFGQARGRVEIGRCTRSMGLRWDQATGGVARSHFGAAATEAAGYSSAPHRLHSTLTAD